jgi:dolichol-phosphate mannosyltransferase
MLMGGTIVVVVPARDEAPRITRVLRGMPKEVDYIVVVDDASRDRTADAARAHRDPRVSVLTNRARLGVGGAIARGYRAAMDLTHAPQDAFVVMAGDGQMDPRDLHPLVLPILRGEADYVKGDRFSWTGSARSMPLARRIGGEVFSWLTSLAVGRPITDSQCGYTALARSACAQLDLFDLWPSYGYPNDLLGQLVVRGLRVAEVSVRPVYADEISRFQIRHLAGVAAVVARAWVRRRRAEASVFAAKGPAPSRTAAVHGFASSALELLPERLAHRRRRPPAHVAPVARDLAHE